MASRAYKLTDKETIQWRKLSTELAQHSARRNAYEHNGRADEAAHEASEVEQVSGLMADLELSVADRVRAELGTDPGIPEMLRVELHGLVLSVWWPEKCVG